VEAFVVLAAVVVAELQEVCVLLTGGVRVDGLGEGHGGGEEERLHCQSEEQKPENKHCEESND